MDKELENFVEQAMEKQVYRNGIFSNWIEAVVKSMADFRATPLEGTPASGVVILKFPGESNIIDFLTDPEYQSVKDLRLSITTHANAVMAPEYKS